MSGFPGANRPHGGHHTVMPGGQPYYQQQQQGPPQGFPQPGGGGGQWGPPPPGPPPGNYGNYGGGGYDQQGGGGGYGGGGGGFPHPQTQQPYAPPPGFPAPQQQYNQYQQPSGPYPPQQQQEQNRYQAPQSAPPMHYGGQVQQSSMPSQYQGGQFAVHMQPTQNSQMYSNCSGRRKALCIGINYPGTSAELRGCHNDARNISKFLCERYQYKQEDIVMLLDTPGADQMSVPTRANITRAMQWLVRDARPNDALFFHYSGHGGQAEDLDGDEDDGYDETIYPSDFKTAGQMVDDEMHAIMVSPLPQGCRLTAIFDSCHSGSSLDLPYIYSTSGKIKEPNMLADAGSGALGALTSYARGDLGGVFKQITSVGKKMMNGNKAQNITRQTRSSNADVISWSGCKDSQTSADASEAGKATGAMSYAFIASLSKYPQQTYLQLLNTIRDELQGKYSQKPQLSCSHELDTSLLFVA